MLSADFLLVGGFGCGQVCEASVWGVGVVLPCHGSYETSLESGRLISGIRGLRGLDFVVVKLDPALTNRFP